MTAASAPDDGHEHPLAYRPEAVGFRDLDGRLLVVETRHLLQRVGWSTGVALETYSERGPTTYYFAAAELHRLGSYLQEIAFAAVTRPVETFTNPGSETR